MLHTQLNAPDHKLYSFVLGQQFQAVTNQDGDDGPEMFTLGSRIMLVNNEEFIKRLNQDHIFQYKWHLWKTCT